MISYTIAVFRCIDEQDTYLIDVYEDNINTHRTTLKLIYTCDYYQMDTASFFDQVAKFRLEGCKYRVPDQELFRLLIFFNYQMRLHTISNSL
jgi:hypothetical protein